MNRAMTSSLTHSRMIVMASSIRQLKNKLFTDKITIGPTEKADKFWEN
jgi:hypothetical protein